MRFGWLYVALGCAASIPTPARAETPESDIELTWIAPPGCPSAPEVRAEIADAMGGAGPARRLRATAHVISETPSLWRVELVTEIGGRAQTRSLRASSCTEAASAVATVLALDAADREPPTATRPAETPPRPAPTPEARPIARFGAGVSAAGSTGATGPASFALGGHVAWVPGRTRLELDALYFFPSSVERSGDLTADFDLIVGALIGCHALVSVDALALSPCLGAEVGRLHGRGGGAGILESAERSSLWIAAEGGALGEWKLGRFAIRMRLDAIVPFARHRWAIDDIGYVYRPAAVSGRATVGGEVHFP